MVCETQLLPVAQFLSNLVPSGKLMKSHEVCMKSFTTPQKRAEQKPGSELSLLANRAPYNNLIVHGPTLKLRLISVCEIRFDQNYHTVEQNLGKNTLV